MDILESALLAEFIGYIKSKVKVNAAAEGDSWAAAVRYDSFSPLLQLLRSEGAAVRDDSFSALLQLLQSEGLRGQEVLHAADRAAAVASSARHFLAGFNALFICSAEVAAKMLQAGAGGDLDMFVKVLGLDAARAAATKDDMDVDESAATEDDMDVDGRLAPDARHDHRHEGSGRSCASVGSVAALFPSSGAKRKHAHAFGGGEVDTVQRKKRRLLPWTRSHQRSGFGRRQRLPSGPSEPPRRVALAMSRIQRRIGNPTTTRHRPQPSLGLHFSRIRL